MTTNRPILVVNHNSHIDIEFQLALLDGTVVEETQENSVLTFTLGDGTFLPNLEEMLIGLEQGTMAKFTLSPERAFGVSDPLNVHEMARQDFPKDLVLQEGFVIGFNLPTGEEIPGTLLEIGDQHVLVDLNHPLADQTVVFTATIKAILS